MSTAAASQASTPTTTTTSAAASSPVNRTSASTYHPGAYASQVLRAASPVRRVDGVVHSLPVYEPRVVGVRELAPVLVSQEVIPLRSKVHLGEPVTTTAVQHTSVAVPTREVVTVSDAAAAYSMPVAISEAAAYTVPGPRVVGYRQLEPIVRREPITITKTLQVMEEQVVTTEIQPIVPEVVNVSTRYFEEHEKSAEITSVSMGAVLQGTHVSTTELQGGLLPTTHVATSEMDGGVLPTTYVSTSERMGGVLPTEPITEIELRGRQLPSVPVRVNEVMGGSLPTTSSYVSAHAYPVVTPTYATRTNGYSVRDASPLVASQYISDYHVAGRRIIPNAAVQVKESAPISPISAGSWSPGSSAGASPVFGSRIRTVDVQASPVTAVEVQA